MINVRSWWRMHCICISMTSQELRDDRPITSRTLAPSLTPKLGKSGWIIRPSARFLNQVSTSLPYRTIMEPGYSSTKVLSLRMATFNQKVKNEKFKYGFSAPRNPESPRSHFLATCVILMEILRKYWCILRNPLLYAHTSHSKRLNGTFDQCNHNLLLRVVSITNGSSNAWRLLKLHAGSRTKHVIRAEDLTSSTPMLGPDIHWKHSSFNIHVTSRKLKIPAEHGHLKIITARCRSQRETMLQRKIPNPKPKYCHFKTNPAADDLAVHHVYLPAGFTSFHSGLQEHS